MANKTEEILEEAKGSAKEVKARLKEAVGDILDNEDLEREGKAERRGFEEEQKAEALEELAAEQRQKAAGYKGEAISRKQN